ncbi:nuclear transport factor 2 family protein [Agrobacterium tumefaciens]|uniref:nuclear transport factor 2 family protein n=1 Tax=Agrobacterium tumefaciens TaxID=358 RepID=UPI0015740BF2|nr:nuclear transport factor 2 family protein [Agrobacterium tumefaciens]NTC44019.1 nuclear transport factor 2 family protein [Agrobacterium tumefaciens]
MSSKTALEADQERLEACIASDITALKALMSDNCLYIHTAGNVDNKSTFIDKVETGALRYHRIENTVEYTIEHERAVAISGILDMDLQRAGVPASVHIRYCCVWVDTDQGPRMITWQSTPLPA